MKLIVGLGNPGERFDGTRHNLGFKVVEEFARKNSSGESVWQDEDGKFKAQILRFPEQDLLLVKPLTYMNNSGESVALIASYFKVSVDDLIVIHDELDLTLGKIKIRVGGSAAGHHGVESIIDKLNDDKFARVRLGIGNIQALEGERGRKSFDAEKFVVSDFEANEKSKVKHMVKQAVEALQIILDKGIEKAQNQYN